MHFWNLLSHENSGGTARTYKAKKLLLCILVLKHRVWFSFAIEISLWLCLYKQVSWCRKKRSIDQSSWYSGPHTHTACGCFVSFTEFHQAPHIPDLSTTHFIKLSKEQNDGSAHLCTPGTELWPLEGVFLLCTETFLWPKPMCSKWTQQGD